MGTHTHTYIYINMALTSMLSATKPTVRAATSSVYDKSRKYADIKEATAAGLDGACAPFPEGLDILGFCKGINGGDLQRDREAEITHGRVAMIATVGFLVGEQVEGSSFLFDAQVTGPAIDHFQQTPGLVWGLVGATIFLLESTRVQKGWSDPFTSELFSLNDDYVPGQWGFDPLGLSKNKTAEDMAEARFKEINNGRLAMISISGMVAQELVNGLNLIPADEVLEEGRGAALVQMGKQCAGAVDEAACAKAFEPRKESRLPPVSKCFCRQNFFFSSQRRGNEDVNTKIFGFRIYIMYQREGERRVRV